ncbi:MAG: filamentous hemagglutinin family protein [Betaproteobacteria bacterium]
MRRKHVPYRLKALSAALLMTMAPAAFPAGLVLPPGVLPVFQGVAAGTVTVSAVPNLLTVNQSSQSAILDWSSFNVAHGAEVRFVQPNAGASALNRIYQSDPSVIQGRVTANGQVYLINQNGILFDQGSQINVGTLLASTLRMPDDVYLAGLNAVRTSPALEAEVLGRSTGIDLRGSINVAAGGSVLVFAPRITNTGTISAPDGQVILAAGERVWLAANSPQDLTLRGMLVEFQAGADEVNLASVVTNQGTIDAPRGNVTLAALAVNQDNRVSASTAVLQNGSVWLTSKEKDTGRRGTIDLGAGSATGTPLDTTDSTTLAEDQDYSRYRAIVRIEAKSLIARGRVEAPGGIITVDVRDAERPGGGRVFLDSGAVISAAGSWADLPMSKNLLTVLLTSNELKDAPVQKGGSLQGQKVTIDVRTGTSLFDESGFVGAIKRTVSEKAATGGEITIVADGDVIVRPGAQIDVSGGGYRFAEGTVSTSKLLSNGKVYDIGEAAPDLQYDAILNQYELDQPRAPSTFYAQFGATTARREAADVQGRNGGTLTISATGGTVIEGTLMGGATAGRYQLDAGRQPLGATFVLGDKTQLGAGVERPDLGQSEVRFSAAADILGSAFGAGDALPANLVGVATLPLAFFQRSTVAPSGEYRQAGFGTVELYANDRISLAPGQTIRMPAGGSIVLGAGNVDVEGSILAPGGVIDVRGIPTSSVSAGLPVVKVGSGARLDAHGLWINDSGLAPAGEFTTASGNTALPRLLDGGRIVIASGDVDLQAGSMLDVTGGARLLNSNDVVGGKGGSIQVRTGLGRDDEFFVGSFRLDSSLLGFGLAGGGSLDIHAGKVRIASAPGTDPAEFLVRPADFVRGFAGYAIAGIAGLTIASGTQIEAFAPALVLDPVRAVNAATGAAVAAFTVVDRSLPEALRQPVAVSLAASGVNAGRLVMEAGATLAVDPRGQITLSAVESMAIHGALLAPAGTIDVELQGGRPGSLGTGSLLIGAQARLVADGRVVATQNSQGQLIGDVLSGGRINLTSSKSALVTEAGSLIDVSAVSGALDVRVVERGIPMFRRQNVAGAAGAIAVAATAGVILDGDLRGFAAGDNVGGSFSLALLRNADLGTEAQRRIVVSATRWNDRQADPSFVDGFVRADTLAAGGIESVQLHSQDLLEFRGDVSLAARRRIVLDAQAIGAIGGGRIDLAAAEIALQASADDPLLAALTPRPAAPTQDGGAHLSVQAGGARGGVLDLAGDLTLNGFADVLLASAGDLRLSGNLLNAVPDQDNLPDQVRGSLTTTADVTLSAAQIYPTTFSDYAVRLQSLQAGNTSYQDVAGSELRILGNGNGQGAVISAGGKLSFAAETIVLDRGVVKAPLGQLQFDATERVTVGAGSLVTVSGQGVVVPYGTTRVGQDWYYAGIPVAAPPVKSISFSGSDVSLNAGAKIDVSGGGEIQAYEFLPGPGGSQDTLAAAGTYAILPWLGSTVAPRDTALLGQASSAASGAEISAYDTVYLSGMGGLAAGYYTLMPGQYALLPGAYVIRPQSAARFRDMAPGQNSALADGTAVVAGYRAVGTTGQRDSRWTGFAVESPDAARRRSEYVLSDSSFFTRQAANADARIPFVPLDAGRISLEATRTLALDSTIVTAAAQGGRSGSVDISASAIAVVAVGGSAPAGYLVLEAGRLRALDARLLLGGRRDDATGETIVTAGDILVANSADDVLSAPEIVLAATDTITVAAGSVIRGEGTFAGEVDAINLQGNGALLRVASGAQAAVARIGATPGAGGVLSVADGATIAAARSLLFDATGDTRVDGALEIGSHGALSIGARQISLGETALVTDGFVLDNQQLAALPDLDQLVLHSYQTIAFHGDSQLGSNTGAGDWRLREIVLDAQALAGTPFAGANAVTIAGASVVLQNTTGLDPDPAIGGPGTLHIDAQRLTLGSGVKALSGFDVVTLDAAHEVSGAGTGTLALDGSLVVNAGRFVGRTRSDQSITAGAVTLRTVALADGDAFARAPIGGRWTITGVQISQGGRFDLPAGGLTLVATQGDLILAPGSQINAGAMARDFSSTPGVAAVAYAAGGQVELAALTGAVHIETGALVDVSGTAEGGDGGSLIIRALGSGGTAVLAGSVQGTATAGARGATFALDADRIDSLAGIVGRLSGGFDEAVDIRVRAGDLALGSGETLGARRIRLSADAGSIEIAGTLDGASGRNGNRIDVFAGHDLLLAGGALLDVRGLGGSAPGSARDGGTVNLLARDGTLSFAQGAVIDVSTAGSGNGGEAIFTATRTGTGLAVALDGTIKGTAGAGALPARITVVGNLAYEVAQVDAATVAADASNAIWNDYQAFTGGVAASAVLGGLELIGTDVGRARVVAGVELRSSGDMTVSAAWNLAAADWLAPSQPGVLTLRAAGTLDIRNAIGQSNDNLTAADTWSLRLVGGADLGAADPRAVGALVDLADAGDVLFSTATAAARTGTGFIDIVAGRNVELRDKGAVVYTAGTPGFGGGATNQYATGGGDVRVSAQQDIVGPGQPVFVNDWLFRTNARSIGAVNNQPGGWWANRASVRQAFATLGGGDLELSAGRDVTQVYALTPTSGRVDSASATTALDVTGGGDLDVTAGRNISGGQYLLSLGRGSLSARDTVGGDAPTGVYLMGLGSSQVVTGGAAAVAGARSGAELSIVAGGDVTLASISNPTILALSAQDRIPRAAAHFFSYAEDSSVTVRAYAGDIRVGNEALTRRSVIAGNVPTGSSDIAPPRLDLVAFSGSIQTDRNRPLEGRIRTYPSPRSSVRLLAGEDIADIAFEVTDVVPDSLPQWYRAAGVQGERAPSDAQLVFGALAPRRLVTASAETGTPFEVIAVRDIVDTELFLPRRARIESGRDTVNLKAELQNLGSGDLSVVRAGRDLRYAPFYANGQTVADNGGFITIGGPGRLVVQTGRDLNLGVTEGLAAVGANANLALAIGRSADLTVLVGVNGEYPQDRINAFFDVLARVGQAQADGRTDRLDAALADADAAAIALFGAGQATDRGNLTMYFSRIRTEGGSGIDILVPRGVADNLSAGNINAGLPGTGESDIGIVTVLGGDIRTYLQNSFNVNQSKVATLQGGDISIFSREGNIDAGRGARDSRTTQPPRRVPITAKDPVTGQEIETGLFAYLPPLDASGSGIRTFTSDPDGPGPLVAPKPGSVTLIAPRGFIDAGEAGVDAAGGLIVFAPTLINSQNFSSGGASVGVPVNNAAGVGAALSAAGNSAAGAAKAGDDLAKGLPSGAPLAGAKLPSFITVQVVGFGGDDESGSGKDKKEDAK